MPSRNHHIEFDKVLASDGIIPDDVSGAAVHNHLDSGSKKYGAQHRELDPNHDPEAVRDRINAMVCQLGTITQVTATAYVRIGYGHVVLDEIASQEKRRLLRERRRKANKSELDWDWIYGEALTMIRQRGYHKKYYRGGSRGLGEKVKDFFFGPDDRARRR